MKVNILKLSSAGYPTNLTHISSPPKRLYTLGASPQSWLNMPKVGIVGSRKMTPYGRLITRNLSDELARAGVVIVSGLAFGVDICAHQAALAAGGITVAVLGTSVEDIYPAAHAQFAEKIVQQGSIISEYPPGTQGFPANFIARNRIISGLSDVLLITEAAVNSGSLHTARFALEQGKTVMAVPGNINSPISEGCNNLIKSGALPVTSVEDIFFALGIEPQKAKSKNFKGTPAEQQILGFIKEGVNGQDELAEAAKLDVPALSSVLTMLEIHGHIRPAGGGNWVAS